MTVHLYGTNEIEEYEIPKAHYESILNSLNGARPENNPMKWAVLGSIDIKVATESIVVQIFSVKENPGVFEVGDTYYRGGSTNEFLRIISEAKKLISEEESFSQPADSSGGLVEESD